MSNGWCSKHKKLKSVTSTKRTRIVKPGQAGTIGILKPVERQEQKLSCGHWAIMSQKEVA